MDFLKLASERFSVREFTDEPINQETIDKILKAAHVAPTGCNYQPFRILVINTAGSVEKLKKCTKCHFSSRCAMLVCYNKDECWTRKYDGAVSGPVDACIVTTHMMLEATELGIGSCWVMHFDPAAMRQEFNIPENIEPVALLVMGHPKDGVKPLNLHNEFRALDELVVYDKFE